MKDDKSKTIMLSIVSVLSLVIITIGVTYAIFTYTKLGSIENTITAGTLKFLYTENTGVGAGINITNAFPVADAVGMAYTGDNQVFDFKVEGENASNNIIPYEVTLRQSDNSTLDATIVKVYLTDTTEGVENAIVSPTKFTLLTDTSVDSGKYTEKTLYKGSVPAKDTNYLMNFRLRMWIDETADFSATSYYKDTSGNIITVAEYNNLTTTEKANYKIITHVNTATNDMLTQIEYDALADKTNISSIDDYPIYPYNGKTFKATVNVYANAEVVSSEE